MEDVDVRARDVVRRKSCWYKSTVNATLRDRGYLPVTALIEPGVARFMYKTLLLKQWRGECARDDQTPTAASLTDDASTDALLLEVHPRIEAISGCRLVPTFSYARLYFRGDALLRHHDRTACEVSASIHLGRDGGESSLCFAPDSKVNMDDGDGVVYLGRLDHWREPFAGNTMGQIFLHYVVAAGRFAHLSMDGRPERCPPSIRARAATS